MSISAPTLPSGTVITSPRGQSALAPEFSSLFFALFIVFMPWEWVRGDEFADLVNYTTRIYDLRDYGMRAFQWEDTILGWLKFEYLWFALLTLVAKLNVEPAVFLSSVTFFSAFLTHRFLRQYIGALLAGLVLANPISIDLMSSQVRSALAFSVFLALAGGSATGKWAWVRWGAMLALPFIHTAMTMILAVFAGAKIITVMPRLSPVMRSVLIGCGAAVMVVVVATFLPTLADEAGDRRQLADYGNKTAAYVMFWLLLGIALAASAARRNAVSWEYAFATFITLFGSLAEFLSLPGFRFVALAIPVIFAAMPLMKKELRQGSMVMTAAYGVLLVYYWVR
ncbi:EpsG family protein [Ahrensia sp. R2A130]|uniref:EpsG family protein n=1 Tax=Ahrensia sp. R2A130 TaxID=744979 RepID=UPI0001E08C8F|nr:EpsG family protein [Ahrensia sp. R2A130]EFL89124.1 putative membrane protein [Ahrensia sp. R2A130]